MLYMSHPLFHRPPTLKCYWCYIIKKIWTTPLWCQIYPYVIWYDTCYWNLSQDEINLTEHYLSFIKCFVSTSTEKIMLLHIAIISYISYDTDMISIRDWMAKASVKMNDILVSKNSFSLQIYCCVPGSRGLHWQWRGATGGRSRFIFVHPPIHWLTAKKGVHQFRFFLSNMRTQSPWQSRQGQFPDILLNFGARIGDRKTLNWCTPFFM